MGLYLGNSEKLKININDVACIMHLVTSSNKENAALGTSILGIMKLGMFPSKTSAILGVSTLGTMKLGG